MAGPSAASERRARPRPRVPAPGPRCRGSSRAGLTARSFVSPSLYTFRTLRKRQLEFIAMPRAAASRSLSVRASRSADAAATFSIGELAREFGLTTRAIRFYEDCGLLAPQRSGRNRIYTARDRARLTLTLRGKRLGLKLAEVKDLVDMYETRRDTDAQLRSFLDVLARHRAQLEARLGELRTTLDEVLAQEAAAPQVLRKRAKA